MKTKRLLSATIMLLAALTLYANPRSKQTIARAAAEVLNSSKNNDGIKHSPRREKLIELQSNNVVTIMGYPSGGYAIMGNDDCLPLVLGYSETKYDEGNPGIQWYLSAIKNSAESISNDTSDKNYLDSSIYNSNVPSFITTKWGQGTPYNGQCPSENYSNGTTRHAYTGCVATAMAQVLFFNKKQHKNEEWEYDKESASFRHRNGLNESITVDFYKSHYDYDNMLESYTGTYSSKQADAVAKLMLDCGVASKMDYSLTESSTILSIACYGMTKHLGYDADRVKELKRDNYANEDWMNMVYKELSMHHPIIYSGKVEGSNIGHAFVLDGYQSDGKVHVNWGWEGQSDGFYDISVLKPNGDSYSAKQEMIIGLGTDIANLDSLTVTVSTPGTIVSSLPDSIMDKVSTLKVVGDINSTDLKQLRKFAGRDEYNHITCGTVSDIDMRKANIVDGGEPYLIDGGKGLTTSVNVFPRRAFSKCDNITTLRLPESIDSIADGALAEMPNVKELYVPTGSNKKYIVSNGLILTADSSEVICVLPDIKSKSITIPIGTRRIHDYAFEGKDDIQKVIIPLSVKYIGTRAFAGMMDLNCFRSPCAMPPLLGNDVFANGLTNRTLEVVLNSKKAYEVAEQWNSFNKIRETKYKLKPKTTSKIYGNENPVLKWEINELSDDTGFSMKTKATKTSDVAGWYIYVEYDKKTMPDSVEILGGTLYIEKRNIHIKVNSATVCLGDTTFWPTFTVEGLPDFETAEDLGLYVSGYYADVEGDYIYAFGPYNSVNDRGKNYGYMGFNTDWWQYEKTYVLSVGIDGKSRSSYYNYTYTIHGATLRVIKPKTTDIQKTLMRTKPSNGSMYNLSGQQVDDDYKGIVIVDGKKYYKR